MSLCAPVAKLEKKRQIHYQWGHQSWPIKPARLDQFKSGVLQIRNDSFVMKRRVTFWHFCTFLPPPAINASPWNVCFWKAQVPCFSTHTDEPWLYFERQWFIQKPHVCPCMCAIVFCNYLWIQNRNALRHDCPPLQGSLNQPCSTISCNRRPYNLC